jgi:hypothetical protein
VRRCNNLQHYSLAHNANLKILLFEKNALAYYNVVAVNSEEFRSTRNWLFRRQQASKVFQSFTFNNRSQSYDFWIYTPAL